MRADELATLFGGLARRPISLPGRNCVQGTSGLRATLPQPADESLAALRFRCLCCLAQQRIVRSVGRAPGFVRILAWRAPAQTAGDSRV